jgi:hypothetical protein
MPDIIAQPLTTPRSPPRTRLRPATLTASVRARQQQNLRRRRRILENKLRNLEAVLRTRTQQQTALIPQVTLANSHMLDDIHRSGRLERLIRDTSRRSQMEELTQTDVGQRNTDVEQQLHEYERNRPYDIETINRLRAEMYSLNDAMFANTQTLLAPLIEERTLAQANHDIGYNRHLNLDQELFNISLLIGNLTQERDDLLRQSNDLNRELGRGHRIRQRHPTHKRHKKGKNTRKRRF